MAARRPQTEQTAKSVGRRGPLSKETGVGDRRSWPLVPRILQLVNLMIVLSPALCLRPAVDSLLRELRREVRFSPARKNFVLP